MSIYEVTARQEYRGHKPGDRFEAQLDRNAEARAMRRGAIKLIHRSVPRLVEGSYRLPNNAAGGGLNA